MQIAFNIQQPNTLVARIGDIQIADTVKSQCGWTVQLRHIGITAVIGKAGLARTGYGFNFSGAHINTADAVVARIGNINIIPAVYGQPHRIGKTRILRVAPVPRVSAFARHAGDIFNKPHFAQAHGGKSKAADKHGRYSAYKTFHICSFLLFILTKTSQTRKRTFQAE